LQVKLKDNRYDGRRKTYGRFAGGATYQWTVPVLFSVRLRGNALKATQKLRELGQSLWLDQITREILNCSKFRYYIEELSVTGVTFNPTIFNCAIKNSSVYDVAIRKKLKEDKLGEELFYELALEDLSHAADLLKPIFEKTGGVDGWVSLEVSPLLIHETATILAAAEELYNRVRRPNFFIKIPGTKEGLPAVEEAIFAGIPVNVTLLFSREHYLAAAGAFLRGIERRIAAGLKPNIGSVASIFVSRWDAAVKGKVPDGLCNQLGIAIAQRTYTAYRDLLSSPRWQRANNAGARPQRLLWVGTETKDPESSEDFYIKALAAPFTINSMSESILNALADHGEIGTLMPADGGDCEAELIRFAQAGIDIDALADELQNEEVASSIKSWFELMSAIASKSAALVQFQW
jgi:transaldolase